ncbi:MAG: YbbN family protein [Planctomycetota bacterium]|jgi:hypothetical protein
MRGRSRLLALLLCLAVVSVVGVLGAASREAAPARDAARRSAPPDPARSGPGVHARPPAAPPRVPIHEALRDVVHGTPAARDAGERALIGHGEAARRPVETALGSDLPSGARGALRYVLTAIEESRAPRAARPQLVRHPPRSGLLLFCGGVDDRTAPEIDKVRRTGKVEGMEVTVVFAAGCEGRRLVEEHAARLRDVKVYCDDRGELAERLRIRETPAVAGLHADGRLGFLLAGSIPRTRLARNIALLSR